MAEEINSAARATFIAKSFLEEYYSFLRPISAVRENGHWVVKIDVGPLAKVIASVKIDAQTGEILEYDIP